MMAEKFGATSTEAINAAKKVASLRDAIGDAKALAETFNPDKKFVALGGAIQGAVSGFSALQGASALFGEESKDLEKTLLKVQSVMALQQGISGIFGAIDSFKLLANTIKVNVVSAFSTMKNCNCNNRYRFIGCCYWCSSRSIFKYGRCSRRSSSSNRKGK